MEEICELFLQCSHSEQLILMKKLPSLIRRDFIGQLPLLALVRVLHHLPTKDIISCLRVCRYWYTTIKSCDIYWRSVCLQCGLSLDVVGEYCRKEKEGNIMNVALRSEIHVSNIKQTLGKSTLVSSINRIPNVSSSVRLFSHQDCYGKVALTASSSRHSRSAIEIVAHYNEMDELLITFPLVQLCRIVCGCHADSESIVYATNLADWGKMHCPSAKNQLWSDDKVVSSCAKIAACRKCGLIVEGEPQPHAKGEGQVTWKMEFVCLDFRIQSVRRAQRYAVLKKVTIPENEYSSIQSMALLSASLSAEGTCSEHWVLIQLGSGIAVFSFHGHTKNSEPISKSDSPTGLEHVNTYIPQGHTLLSLNSLGDTFRLSYDDKLLGLIICDVLYVWDVISFSLLSTTHLRRHIGAEQYRCSLLAVGNLYSVIHSIDSQYSYLHVLSSTVNDKVLLSLSVCKKEEMGFCAPIRQGWLNHLGPFDSAVFPSQNPFRALVFGKGKRDKH